MTPPHLSQTTVAGNLIFTSGQLAFMNGEISGDIRDQTRQVLANLAGVLKPHALDLTAVVKTTVWLTRQQDFAAFNEVYAEVFAGHKPARSTTIAALAIDAALIEIEAIAVCDADRSSGMSN